MKNVDDKSNVSRFFEVTTPSEILNRMILDEARTVVAYERRAVHPGALSSPLPALARPTFLRVSCAQLAENQLDDLDPAQHVLEATTDLRDASDNDHCIGLLRGARARGFKLALDVRLLEDEFVALIPLASYFVLEASPMDLDKITEWMDASHLRSPAVATLATNVRTAAEFERLKRAGVQLYEGSWYIAPPTTTGAVVPLSFTVLIKLLDLVAREAEVADIEELLRHEPTLAYKLLRYINSCGFGLRSEITSFRHAVLTIGLKQLFRWTTLLIATTPSGSVAPAVGTLAIVRARTMELLALDNVDQAEADLAFVCGMFSLMDVLLGMRIEDALTKVTLPKAVTDALLRNEGPCAPYLRIARACEGSGGPSLDQLEGAVRFSRERILHAYVDALAWAEQIGV